MRFTFLLFLAHFAAAEAATTPLVSGNGHGFVVFSEAEQALTKFYAHPYRFVRPDPEHEFGEGIETANFLRSLRWGEVASSRYVDESQVIETSGGEGQDFYFLPFGLNRNALVTGTTRPESCLRVSWSAAVQRDKALAGNVRLLEFAGVEEKLLAIPVGSGGSPGCSFPGNAWAFVSVEKGDDAAKVAREIRAWALDQSIEALVARELTEVEAWRVKPAVRFLDENERKLWRQSEMVLRMAQSREPNRRDRANNGMILASLPEGMWFVSWVRDMAYAAVALTRMGHQAEARAALRAYFQAKSVGKMRSMVKNYPYQISVVRYFGDGSEEPFFTMAGSPNIEFDNWGLVLWALSEYVEKFGDDAFLREATPRGSVFQVARDFIAKPLIGNFVPMGIGQIVDADTSIWEEHQWDKQHFLFSSAAGLAGLRGFKIVAERGHHRTLVAQLAETTQSLEFGILNAFADQDFLMGTMEGGYKNIIDAAALEAVNLGVTQDLHLILRTLEMADELKVASGGYRRVRGDTPYEKHEFLFSNFSVARNFLRINNHNLAQPIVEKMVRKSALDNFLVPEMYVSELSEQFPGEIGAPTGSTPMVGYGAGVYVMYLIEREEVLREK